MARSQFSDLEKSDTRWPVVLLRPGIALSASIRFRELVDAINAGRSRAPEPGVAERLAKAAPGALKATTSADEAIAVTDVSMVIVPTPSNTLGGFSLRYVLNAIRTMGDGIKKKSERHTVAVVEYGFPGASDRYIIPALESATGHKVGEGIGYCYNPSFIAARRCREAASNIPIMCSSAKRIPPRVMRSMPSTARCCATTHRSRACSDRSRNCKDRIKHARDNARRVCQHALRICSEVPEADVDRITGASAYRMGRRFFKGASPTAGPCWPRDNRALSVFMDAIGVPSMMPRTIDFATRSTDATFCAKFSKRPIAMKRSVY